MPEPDSKNRESYDPAQDPDAAQWFKGDAFRGVLTPLLAGLIIDMADLVTFGPIGRWLGFGLGALLGWQLAPRFGAGHKPWAPALLAGLYCMTPGTALLPLATLVSSAIGFGSAGSAGSTGSTDTPTPPKASGEAPTIEPSYTAKWDDEVPAPESRKDSADV